MATDLALTRPDPTMDEGSLRVMMAVADRYVKSGLLPSSIKTPQQALVIMGMGRELGIPAAVALRGIVVVQGKPTCSAELMMALVHRTYGQSAMRVARTDNDSCTVQYRQSGWDGVSEYTFSMDDAKRANLLKNPTWNQYPAAMLRARAISAVVRFAFPECISGVYTPDEVGGSVTVVDGEVIVAEGEREHAIDCKAIARNRPDACDCWGDDVPTPDMQDGPSFCDADHFNKAWHAAVKGTRFEDDETRHKFISWYTKGRDDSLSAFLQTATAGEATDLIGSIKNRIAVEAKKARQSLLDELADAIRVANDAAGEEMYAMPDDIHEDSDEDIRTQIADILKNIAAAPVA